MIGKEQTINLQRVRKHPENFFLQDSKERNELTFPNFKLYCHASSLQRIIEWMKPPISRISIIEGVFMGVYGMRKQNKHFKRQIIRQSLIKTRNSLKIINSTTSSLVSPSSAFYFRNN